MSEVSYESTDDGDWFELVDPASDGAGLHILVLDRRKSDQDTVLLNDQRRAWLERKLREKAR